MKAGPDPPQCVRDPDAQCEKDKEIFCVIAGLEGVVPLVEEFGQLANQADRQHHSDSKISRSGPHGQDHTFARRRPSMKTALHAGLQHGFKNAATVCVFSPVNYLGEIEPLFPGMWP